MWNVYLKMCTHSTAHTFCSECVYPIAHSRPALGGWADLFTFACQPIGPPYVNIPWPPCSFPRPLEGGQLEGSAVQWVPGLKMNFSPWLKGAGSSRSPRQQSRSRVSSGLESVQLANPGSLSGRPWDIGYHMRPLVLSFLNGNGSRPPEDLNIWRIPYSCASEEWKVASSRILECSDSPPPWVQGWRLGLRYTIPF